MANTNTMMMGTMTTGAASTTTIVAAMGGMGGMSGGNGCKISMLWNWYTVDACFISSSWRVTSAGMFAASCIGTILLSICLEILRRSVKEYDTYLIRTHTDNYVSLGSSGGGRGEGSHSPNKGPAGVAFPLPIGYRPSLLQQTLRALLHMLQFAVAYFIMLLAMYYNGYIIICIFIGIFLGAFFFQWETLGRRSSSSGATGEATVCCG
ncbi:high affinity copper transporter [Podospora didyma]|uniref:Copper transport protein n=1 Tax=Podospora didyma TaxID=330526 RepID=A0AAE0TZZ2_9PEZI|nr:high affinity copper transporter [Podospora didyma]